MTEEEIIEEEEPVQTGCISLSVTDTNDKPIKNVTILLTDRVNVYTGRTDYNGEVTISDVIYGSYDLDLTRTGYHTVIEDNFVVDDETVTASFTMTHVDPNPDFVEVDLDEVYTFKITGRVLPVYSMSVEILSWIKANLEGLIDDYNTQIFGKVNTGFNEGILKTFGKKPVCDVYIRKVEYSSTFDSGMPTKVQTIVLFYLKGANNHTYLKGCELHDLLMQEFLSNDGFKRLDDVVRDTSITNSEIRNQTIRGGYGVMGAFELTHDLY